MMKVIHLRGGSPTIYPAYIFAFFALRYQGI